MGAHGFDPLIASEREIRERASLMEGKTLGQLEDLTAASLAVVGKGSAGLIIERFFGVTQNSLSAPDFPRAGIELKVVPVTRSGRGRRIKERTFISMIDFDHIVSETWETAHVRKKLDLLLIFYEHLPDEPLESFPILRWLRWQPDEAISSLLEHDWQAIRSKVDSGRAQDLTEAEGFILSACTKGPGGGALRSQPRSDVKATSRAFALKPSFTLNLLLDAEREELPELRTLDALAPPYARFVGGTVGEMSETVGVVSSQAKNWAATVVRKGVSFAAEQDLEHLGLTVRVPRVDRQLLPYEAISFPSFRHQELVEEDWENSLLLSYIEYMLLAPIAGPTRETLPNRCEVLPLVYWSPDVDELATIREEWTMFRDLIRAGKARSLPTEARTEAIHVRTKGRDSRDFDILPDGSYVTKKSFWLNKGLVQGILRRYSA